MGSLRASIACIVAMAACRPSNLTKIEQHGADGGVASFCGNGIIEPGEVCDPPGPKCSPDCKSDLSCGNFIVDSEPGVAEVCDDGNNIDCDGCSANCKSNETCGNKVVDTCKGEQCDTGDPTTTGSCPNCRNAYCGDKFVWAGMEECDDGTNATNGACPKCQFAICGDGYRWSGHEECDLGASNSANAYGSGQCTDQCKNAPYCGDGVTQSNFGEDCDNGSNNSASAYGSGECTDQCKTAPYCGDSNIDSNFGETCDNGANNVPFANSYNDVGACTDQCQPAPYCGDGNVDSGFGEQCDHAGNNGNDGVCDVNCQCVSGAPC